MGAVKAALLDRTACLDCGGTGEVTPANARPTRAWSDEPSHLPTVECPDCRGTGLVPADYYDDQLTPLFTPQVGECDEEPLPF